MGFDKQSTQSRLVGPVPILREKGSLPFPVSLECNFVSMDITVIEKHENLIFT